MTQTHLTHFHVSAFCRNGAGAEKMKLRGDRRRALRINNTNPFYPHTLQCLNLTLQEWRNCRQSQQIQVEHSLVWVVSSGGRVEPSVTCDDACSWSDMMNFR